MQVKTGEDTVRREISVMLGRKEPPTTQLGGGKKRVCRRGSGKFRYDAFMSGTLGRFAEGQRPFADESWAKSGQG